MSHIKQKRLKILKPDEIDELYKRPELSQAEREEYFALDETIQTGSSGTTLENDE